MSGRLLLLLLLLLILLGLFFLFFSPVPPPEPLADYGDAPDGDLGMDTGYYAPFPLTSTPPILIGYANAGIPADFPTVGTDPVPGPFMLDVDDVWINTIPSMEEGATDPADPDGTSNLAPPTPPTLTADNDTDPGLNLLLIWIVPGNPPLALFITFAGADPGGAAADGAVWNVLFDLHRNGEWLGHPTVDEWVVRDEFFLPSPTGIPTVLVSQPFPWPASGPLGRLIFPVWARNMVTIESVMGTVGMPQWDGRGPAGGFTYGEVEDLFVEWTPVGQMLPSPGPGGGGGGAGSGEAEAEYPEEDFSILARFACPETVGPGGSVTCELQPAELTAVGFYCLAAESAAAVAEGQVSAEAAEATVCSADDFEVTAALAPGSLTISATRAPAGGRVVFYAVPDQAAEKRGTDSVAVTGGAALTVRAGVEGSEQTP